MNLHITGHHVAVTDALRAYMVSKLDRVNRHFDHVIDVNVVMSVEKLRQKVEANVHVSGREIHAASEGETSTPPLMSWPTGWTVRCCATRKGCRSAATRAFERKRVDLN